MLLYHLSAPGRLLQANVVVLKISLSGVSFWCTVHSILLPEVVQFQGWSLIHLLLGRGTSLHLKISYKNVFWYIVYLWPKYHHSFLCNSPCLLKICFANNCWCIQYIFFQLGLNVKPINVPKLEPHFAWMFIILHIGATFVFPVLAKKTLLTLLV